MKSFGPEEANVLNYELEMLGYTVTELRKSCARANTALHNVILESFLLHARCLIEFAYPKEQKKKTNLFPDDLYASKYIASWNDIRPPKNPLGDEYESMHKYLAHMTKKRLSKQLWDTMKIFREITVLVHLFYENLPQELQTHVRIPEVDLRDCDVDATAEATGRPLCPTLLQFTGK